ncbi:hypothetical protein [Streptomyces cadmiisoli]|uniref:Uncharacterized protein n=1 Tax=Streptomyces cadmiisoli TaxID=2184053 RepID=A0A2Z4IUL7_9ACTN|nr:hypothetical protein [Streptomyces cadmiisoli]AWW36444.1 hypothetical protein DN051_07150 [Streptomyces cadmiisoli]
MSGSHDMAIWIVVATLFSVLVGIIAGLFAAQLGASPLACWGGGGAAFISIATISLTVIGLFAA